MRIKLSAVISILIALVVATFQPASADDDWTAVPAPADNSASFQPKASTRASSTEHANSKKSADDGAVKVCGERAVAASPAIQQIVSQINESWGTDFPVYETIAPEGPHAASGGCIFYNMRVLTVMMAGRLDVNDPNAVEPLLWAIFAHEVGHQAHQDFAASRASVPDETKELEADRFAGYTLEKIGIRATNLTPFWTMTGDEFGGGMRSHGSSGERVAAFKQGWHLAEWKRPENSQSVESALDEAVAPDNPDAAPQ
jgi:hypothetical protein